MAVKGLFEPKDQQNPNWDLNEPVCKNAVSCLVHYAYFTPWEKTRPRDDSPNDMCCNSLFSSRVNPSRQTTTERCLSKDRPEAAAAVVEVRAAPAVEEAEAAAEAAPAVAGLPVGSYKSKGVPQAAAEEEEVEGAAVDPDSVSS